MKLDLRSLMRDELILICVLAIVLDIVVLFSPPNLFRLLISLLFVSFAPGYALVMALFPSKKSLSMYERMALSLGLSIIIGPLILMIMNYTPSGITLYSALLPVSALTVALSLTAWYQRLQTLEKERFSVGPLLSMLIPKGEKLDKAISLTLLISIVIALGTFYYVALEPTTGERFTEFYLLGVDGKATDYPIELPLGTEGKVIVGIVNREQRDMSYHLDIRIEGTKHGETINIGPCRPEEKWEQVVTFKPDKAGDGQRVEFILYREKDAQPFTSLYLWVNVYEE